MKVLKPLAIGLLIGSMVTSFHSAFAQQPQASGPSVGFNNGPTPRPYTPISDNTGTGMHSLPICCSPMPLHDHTETGTRMHPVLKPGQAPKPAVPQRSEEPVILPPAKGS